MSHFWPETIKFVSSGEKSHRERIFLKKVTQKSQKSRKFYFMVTQISQIAQIFIKKGHTEPTVDGPKGKVKSQKSRKFCVWK